MTDTPLDAYLAELTVRGIDPRAVPIVRALDRASATPRPSSRARSSTRS